MERMLDTHHALIHCLKFPSSLFHLSLHSHQLLPPVIAMHWGKYLSRLLAKMSRPSAVTEQQ